MKALLVIDMLEDFIDKEGGALTTGPAGEEIVDFIQGKSKNLEKRTSNYLYL